MSRSTFFAREASRIDGISTARSSGATVSWER